MIYILHSNGSVGYCHHIKDKNGINICFRAEQVEYFILNKFKRLSESKMREFFIPELTAMVVRS